MYRIENSQVQWKGRPVKSADAATFQVLHPIIGADSAQVFVLGKPFAADRASFTVLSETYAKDREQVYQILGSKLKPVKVADPKSFKALAGLLGRDAQQVYCNGKRLRLKKGQTVGQFRALGHCYGVDSASLYFGTAQVALPADFDVLSEQVALRWFSDNQINMPPITLTDGERCWSYVSSAEPYWFECGGAVFEQLTPLHWDSSVNGATAFFADQRQVWFRGEALEGLNPAKARKVGHSLVSDGKRLWCGARALGPRPSPFAYVGLHSEIKQRRLTGDLVHRGDRLTLYSPDSDPTDLVVRKSAAPTVSLNDALATIFHRMSQLFSRRLPLVTRHDDVVSLWQELPAEAPQGFTVKFEEEGVVAVSLEDGTILREPASCWYSLGCQLWAKLAGRPAGFLPYPNVGAMLPSSFGMHMQIARVACDALWDLTRAAFEAGHEKQARVIAHVALFLTHGSSSFNAEALERLVMLPAELMSELAYRPAHHSFTATTNLSVSRMIVADGWLQAEDFRDRIDVISTLHGALLSTNKTAIFFKEIVPAIMARYEDEPLQAVQEQLAMVLEAALIRGQVDAEVNAQFHYEAMLPVVDFCLAHQINPVVNRARRCEVLWGLNLNTQADAEAEAFIQDLGEDLALPGVYAYRHIYRTPRLWFLRGKIDMAQRPGSAEEAANRLASLKADYQQLLERYGQDSAAWPEVRDLANQIQRLAEQ
ncbi:MAG: DKNYY domain-containing protein [Lysobacterales bacterium]